jgi:hypothetical protein
VIRFLVPILAGAAVALAVAPSASAATCHHPGVTHIGSGKGSIEIVACRAAAANGGMREYGQIFIGSTSTRATGCIAQFSSERLRLDGRVEATPYSNRSCKHLLRKNRSEMLFGGAPPRPIPWYEKAQRTVVRLYLLRDYQWQAPITAISRWVWVRR